MDNLKIPHSVREGLTLLGQNCQLSIEGLELILERVFRKALSLNEAESNVAAIAEPLQCENALEAVDRETLAKYFGNLATFTTLCARQNAKEVAVRDYVTNCGWGASFADAYVKRYTPSLPKIRSYLAVIGGRDAKLVDVNWRLDLQHKNGQLGVTNSIVYLVEFQLENDGRRETLRFSASKAELEDLVSVLRDATHCAKRVAS